MKRRLCVIVGDGVGREVVPAAVEVLRAVVPELEAVPMEAGWECFRRRGTALPPETLEAVRACGAALFGAVASPSSGRVPGYRSPIVALRCELELYANVRPTRRWPVPWAGSARLRPGVAVDLLIVRENTEGLYVGRERREGDRAVAERVITRQASERVARAAFRLARARRRRITVVHKANVLPLTDGLFREAARAVAAEFPDVAVEELLVDAAAYRLVREPERFDVLVMPNLYGDILSDVAAVWGGGLGLAPSLNWNPESGLAVAEPVHGAAPDLAGRGIANPIAAVLSGALLLRHAWGLSAEATRVERAVERTLADGLVTPDLAPEGAPARTTRQLTEALLARLA